MNNYAYFLLPVLVGVAGCGGGSPAVDAAGFSNVSQQEFAFPSGVGAAVVTNEPGFDGLNYNVAMFTYDVTTANKVADFFQLSVDGDPSIDVQSSTEVGGIFDVAMSATNSMGETGTAYYRGTRLASGGYVSHNSINISGDYTFASDGTVFSGNFPSATAVYTGEAYVDDRGGPFDSEYANMTMTADFSSNRADLDVVGAASFVFARGLSIDPTQGRIDGAATIGVTGSPTQPAAVLGYFAGTNAEGVHGVVYNNATNTVDSLDAVFFGVR